MCVCVLSVCVCVFVCVYVGMGVRIFSSISFTQLLRVNVGSTGLLSKDAVDVSVWSVSFDLDDNCMRFHVDSTSVQYCPY